MAIYSPGHARCLGCGYLLRGLPSNRCPECGREFDLNDPKTVDLGRRMEWVGRWMLAPIGWPMFVLAGVILISLFYVTGLPRFDVHPDVIDVTPFFPLSALRGQFHDLTVNERLYAITLYAIPLLIGLWLLRIVLRSVTLLFHHRPLARLLIDSRRQIALLAGIVLMAAVIFFGWPYRVGMALVEAEARPQAQTWAPLPWFQRYPSDSATWAQLTECNLKSFSPRQRVVGLRFLIQQPDAESLPRLLDLLQHEQNAEVAAAALRLAGLYRDPSVVPILERYLSWSDPVLRIAAADGLVYPYNPNAYFFDRTLLRSTPPITVWPLKRARYFGRQEGRRPGDESLSPTGRAHLLQMMLSAATSDEREAAARAMVELPPPNYKLRIAEWGVWVGESGNLKLVQSNLEEIPPFVHRTGNPMVSFQKRLMPEPVTQVFKPIMHISADQPMAVDLNVQIACGRPYVTYPKPDDFAFTGDGQVTPGLSHWMATGSKRTPPSPPPATNLNGLDRPGLPSLTDLRRERPWLIETGPDALGLDFLAVGLTWHSLIVSPTQLPWMTPPAVGSDPKFQWWQRLRSVNSSWISSRGESERFLYYDGPTLARSPVRLGLSGNLLACTEQQMAPQGGALLPEIDRVLRTNSRPGVPKNCGLFIRRSGDRFEARWIVHPEYYAIDLNKIPVMAHDDAVVKFKSTLAVAGLAPDEASGMLDCWRTQFFETDGTRFLLFLTSAQYDLLCPLQVNPAPTTLVRVGIVLTEFK